MFSFFSVSSPDELAVVGKCTCFFFVLNNEQRHFLNDLKFKPSFIVFKKTVYSSILFPRPV